VRERESAGGEREREAKMLFISVYLNHPSPPKHAANNTAKRLVTGVTSKRDPEDYSERYG
jgi:hypothetical protein